MASTRFRQLLEAAEAPAEPDSVQMRRPANSLDPCDEVRGVSAAARAGWSLPTAALAGIVVSVWSAASTLRLTDDDVQGMLVRHLNESANRLTTSIIANHKMQLKAQVGPGKRHQPACMDWGAATDMASRRGPGLP